MRFVRNVIDRTQLINGFGIRCGAIRCAADYYRKYDGDVFIRIIFDTNYKINRTWCSVLHRNLNLVSLIDIRFILYVNIYSPNNIPFFSIIVILDKLFFTQVIQKHKTIRLHAQIPTSHSTSLYCVWSSEDRQKSICPENLLKIN